MDKSINTSTSTAVKTSIPIAQKLSLGIMMLGAFIAFFAVVAGLTNQLVKPSGKPSASGVIACENPGHCYYLSPSGNDTNDGSLNHPWATLGRADDTLRPGDYLYITGGNYSMTAEQRFKAREAHKGTKERHITIKSYCDRMAYFTISGETEDGAVFDVKRGADWFTVDGLCGTRRFLIFTPTQYTRLVSIGHENDSGSNLNVPGEGLDSRQTYHVSFRGIELDGSRVNVGMSGAPPFWAHSSDFVTLENSYIHDFWQPTGGAPGGCCHKEHPEDPDTCNRGPGHVCSGDEEVQGSPSCVAVGGSDFFLIKNNKLERCNFGGIEIAMDAGWWHEVNEVGVTTPRTHLSQYGKIQNNLIDVRYGGGIYLNPASHNLVEGNKVFHIGETTTHSKPGIQFMGVHNTIRDNIFYSPKGAPGSNAWVYRFPVSVTRINTISLPAII